MAKRSVSTFNKVLQSIPSEAEFEITMPADTTTEVWADIDTNITDGQAWVIYGMEYYFEETTPTEPIASYNGNTVWQIQVHRNDDSELFLNYNDDDVMMIHRWDGALTTSGATFSQSPWRIQKLTVTMQPTLRVIWRTETNNTALANVAFQMAGKIFYDKIAAPNIGISKLGSIADL